MHLLLIYMYYLGPEDPGIKRFNEFCQIWAEDYGIRITVLTSQLHYNTGKQLKSYNGRFVVREDDGPATIYRVAAPRTFRQGYTGRALSQLGWAMNIRRLLKQLDKPDVVLAGAPALMTALPLRTAKKRWGISGILEIYDVWPEAIVKMGIAPAAHPAVLALSALERWAYRQADHIVTIFEGQKNNIALRGLRDHQDITSIPHGVMLEPHNELSPTRRQEIRLQLEVRDDQRLVIYAGSHGPMYKLTTLIELADALRARDDIRFASIGEGWEREMLMTEVERRGLTNLSFLGPVPASEVPAYLSAADIACSFVNLKALTGWNEQTYGSFRNAIFDYAAAKLPVLFNEPGYMVREVQNRAKGGLQADTENGIGEMVDRLLYLVDNPAVAREMGENNYREIAMRYNRREMAKTYVKLMHKLSAEKEASRTS